uniref:Uncharacterized protein n=1 Tax=Mesocestoides corti TaxID=53468 RepID=A0A5K3FZE7_MESCO
MPLERKETEDWLRSACSNMSAPSYTSCVEYPSPSMKETGAKQQALLTNHKPEPHVGRHPPRFSYVSVSGWLHIFLVCHSNIKRRRIG